MPQETYEYAGFRYYVYRKPNGEPENMVPIEGQHHVAGRYKHRRAAMDCLRQDEGRDHA